MAISKERLEELTKEGATIWSSYRLNYNVIAVNLTDKKRFVIYTDDMSILDRDTEYTYQLKNLFETRKEAEWALKYHATRTEELNLPMWNEFITEDKYNYYGTSYFVFDNYRLIAKLPDEDDNTEFIGIDVDGNTELYHWDEATEENYEKACNVALKLFIGENNDK